MKENTILLMDTDGDCEALVSAAANRAGRKVLVAKTTRDAFRILEDEMHGLDLVIVDVDPGAHGLALLEAISGCADRPQILVITGLEEAYMIPIARKHGASACLGKPITVQRLGSALNHVFGQCFPRFTQNRHRGSAAADGGVGEAVIRITLTTICGTDLMDSAFRVATRMAMLHRGQIIEEGTPNQMRESDNPVLVQFLNGNREGPMLERIKYHMLSPAD